jgi:threonine/homoserine/homoserine lactone efflux protein
MQTISFLPLLIQGTALGFSAAATPGPFQSFLINQSISVGWRRGSIIAFAPLVSDPIVLLIILPLLNQIPATFINWLSFAGGFFVLYLAWNLWKNWKKSNLQASEKSDNTLRSKSQPDIQSIQESSNPGKEKRSNITVLKQAVLMNLLSPGLYMFWLLVAGPILLSALDQSLISGVGFLIGFYSTMVAVLLTIAYIIHQSRRLGPRFISTLSLISILILVAFGLILLSKGLIFTISLLK